MVSNTHEDDDITDLWFLPPKPEEEIAAGVPWPGAPRETGVHISEWQAEEARCYRALVSAATALARFGQALRSDQEGQQERLALLNTSAVLRAEGVWLEPDHIAQYLSGHLGGGEQARDLSRAGWAVRRLKHDDPTRVAIENDVRAFLGRHRIETPSGVVEPALSGLAMDQTQDVWKAALKAAQSLHPLTRALYAYALWNRMEVTPADDRLEPCIVGMCLGSAGSAAPFLPLVQARAFGRAAAGVQAFYQAVEAGALAGLLELDRLAGWKARADAAISDLSGRIPVQMVAAFLALPLATADTMSTRLNASPSAVRRNLSLFQERGLIQEVTGQSRFRCWRARL